MRTLPSTFEAVVIANLSLGMLATLLLVYWWLRREPFLLLFASFWAAQAVLFFGGLMLPWTGHYSGSFADAALHVLLLIVGVAQPLFLALTAIAILRGRLTSRAICAAVLVAGLFWTLAFAWPPTLSGRHLGAMERFQFGRAGLNCLGFAAFAIAFPVYGKRLSRLMVSLVMLPGVLYSLHYFAIALALGGVLPAYLNYSYLLGTCLPVGIVVGLLISVVDVALEAQRARAEADQRFRILLENIPLAGIILDERGRVRFCNRHLARMFDTAPEQMLNEDWIELHVASGGRPAARESLLGQFRAECAAPVSEEVIQDARGNTHLLCWANFAIPAQNPDQRLLARIGFDQTEERLRAESLAEAQKLESVGRLAGGLAHDLNNYLTVINGYSYLLCQEPGTSDSARERLGRILTAGQQGAELIRQLLAFTRRQVVQPRAIGMNAEIAQAKTMLRQLVPASVELRWDLAARPDTIRIDESQFQQLLLNLVTNARDAIEEAGWILIETSTIEFDAALAAKKSPSQPGPHVVLAVTDSGKGMDEETKARVFEPFFTTKPTGRGTGLGLATVYGIVSNAGGTVWVYSELGRGSTFKILLPLSEQVASLPAAAPETAPGPGTANVLVVEDHDDVRDFIKETLVGAGYKARDAATPGAAMRLIGESGFRPELLITDVVLPEMNGVELARKIGLRITGVEVLYVSGYTPNVIVKQGILQPGFHYLAKPVTPSELLAKVSAVLGARNKARH